MTDPIIYKTLKQIDKGNLRFQKLQLLVQKLVEMELVTPVFKGDVIKGYKLTIKGKIFIWDNENWRL